MNKQQSDKVGVRLSGEDHNLMVRMNIFFQSIGLGIALTIILAHFISQKNLETNVAHAGGGINGHIFTNSLEAFVKNYNQGFRVFEFDITLYNKEFIALHSTKDIDLIISKRLKDNTTNTLIDEMDKVGYTILHLEDIINLKKTYEDITIIFDVKNAHGKRMATYDEIHRLLQKHKINQEQVIIQVFSDKGVKYAKKYFSRLLYSMGRDDNSSLNFIKYLKENNIKFASIHYSKKKSIALMTLWRSIFYRELNILPYTINSRREELFFATLGINTSFTDWLSP